MGQLVGQKSSRGLLIHLQNLDGARQERVQMDRVVFVASEAIFVFSRIPSDEGVLSQTLPIRLPYWLNHTNAKKAVGAPGARVTWLGHATVLAEVDGAVVLTDPIFSQRASLFQWIGPKRYRPVGGYASVVW